MLLPAPVELNHDAFGVDQGLDTTVDLSGYRARRTSSSWTTATSRISTRRDSVTPAARPPALILGARTDARCGLGAGEGRRSSASSSDVRIRSAMWLVHVATSREDRRV